MLRTTLLFMSFLLLLFVFSCDVKPKMNANDNSYGKLGALMKDPGDIKDLPRLRLSTNSASLPVSFDLSLKLPPVGNQGNQNSCVGWAVGYALKTYQEKVETSWDVTIPQNEFSPSWIYNQINFGYDSGAYFESAFNLVISSGADTLANFPYTDTNCILKPDSTSMARALSFKAVSYSMVADDVATIKTLISQGNVIPFACYIYPDFDSLNPSNPIYDSLEGTSRGGHALCIVGYDDSKGAFYIINSWGQGWGINGYGWLSYNLITDARLGLTPYLLVDGTNL